MKGTRMKHMQDIEVIILRHDDKVERLTVDDIVSIVPDSGETFCVHTEDAVISAQSITFNIKI